MATKSDDTGVRALGAMDIYAAERPERKEDSVLPDLPSSKPTCECCGAVIAPTEESRSPCGFETAHRNCNVRVGYAERSLVERIHSVILNIGVRNRIALDLIPLMKAGRPLEELAAWVLHPSILDEQAAGPTIVMVATAREILGMLNSPGDHVTARLSKPARRDQLRVLVSAFGQDVLTELRLVDPRMS